MNFTTIQEFYNLGLWNKSQIAQLVSGGVITPAQYEQITGQAYPTAQTKAQSSTPAPATIALG